MERIFKPALILMSVAFISSLVLSHVQRVTYPKILKREQERQQEALSIVLPGFRTGQKKTVSINGEDFTFWPGVRTGKGPVVRGYAFVTVSSGYSGNVRSIVGVDQAGEVLGIFILKQTETPGLGARCFEVPSKQTFFGYLLGKNGGNVEQGRAWFQEQYRGLSISRPINIAHRGDWRPEMKGELIEMNAISAITGATITSRAVTQSIEKGYVILKKALVQIENRGGGSR